MTSNGKPRRDIDNVADRLFPIEQEFKTSDDYYTPKWLFDALKVEFDLDVACPPEGPLHTPAKRFYSMKHDGLTQPWEGRVWMNPPYSGPKPWVERFIEHANGIALLPFAKSKWHQDLWDSDASMVYVRVITFVKGDTNLGQAPFALGLWAFGQENKKAISNVGRVR